MRASERRQQRFAYGRTSVHHRYDPIIEVESNKVLDQVMIPEESAISLFNNVELLVDVSR